jgi:hypothetical protein
MNKSDCPKGFITLRDQPRGMDLIRIKAIDCVFWDYNDLCTVVQLRSGKRFTYRRLKVADVQKAISAGLEDSDLAVTTRIEGEYRPLQ